MLLVSMAKRPCFSDHSPRVLKRDYDQYNIDTLLEGLFAVSDSALIDASFDGLVDSRSTDSDQNDFSQRAFHLGFVLFEAGKRSVRKRSSVHNATVWPLPTDLTIKVFSMLDTPSVCSAAATCSFFQNCAIDPLCYTNIELLVPVVNDAVVSTMIQRAGNALQSIKLGLQLCDDYRQRQDSSLITSSCLSSLSASGGAIGSQLRRLHLYNIERIDNRTVSASLSICPSFVDLEIVGLFVDDWDVEVSQTLECVSRYCCLLERFIYNSKGVKDDELKTSACEEFVLNCPKITTLAIKKCVVDDSHVRILVKGFHKLKYVDFSGSACFSGAFLKNLGTKGGGKSLEVLILRDCYDLEKVEVKKLLKSLLAGNFKLLRHLDISNSEGLADNSYFEDRHYGESFIPVKKLLKRRPNLWLVAELSSKRAKAAICWSWTSSGFHKLKYVDFSESACFSGSFLKNLGTKGGGKSMEVLILRECLDLDKVKVKKLMKALLAGKFRLLRHLDISNSDGLAYKGDFEDRRYGGSFIPLKKLLKQRPNFCLVAELSKKRYV